MNNKKAEKRESKHIYQLGLLDAIILSFVWAVYIWLNFIPSDRTLVNGTTSTNNEITVIVEAYKDYGFPKICAIKPVGYGEIPLKGVRTFRSGLKYKNLIPYPDHETSLLLANNQIVNFKPDLLKSVRYIYDNLYENILLGLSFTLLFVLVVSKWRQRNRTINKQL